MTDREIKAKIERIKLSEAPIQVKEKAIKELEMKLSSSSAVAVAKQQLIDSAPDYSDIGN